MVRDWRGEWADMQNSLLFITMETALKNQAVTYPRYQTAYGGITQPVIV